MVKNIQNAFTTGLISRVQMYIGTINEWIGIYLFLGVLLNIHGSICLFVVNELWMVVINVAVFFLKWDLM